MRIVFGANGGIGDAYFSAEDYKGAIVSYEKALKADPDLNQTYYKLGEAYKETKKYDDAIKNYKRASAVEPDNALVSAVTELAQKKGYQIRRAGG